MSEPIKGQRQFRVWPGPFSGTIWAGWMRFNGEQWESTGTKHDVTEDVHVAVHHARAAFEPER